MILKCCFQTLSQVSVQIWCDQLGGQQHLCDLELTLRQKAIEIFELVKFDLARESKLLRADLLRPSFGSISCGEIYSQTQTNPAVKLAELSGCDEEDAQRLIRFGRRLSELFAPIELTKQLARQDWSKVPYAGSAALLPAFDQHVRGQDDRTKAGKLWQLG